MFFFKKKTGCEFCSSDWGSDVCSSDLRGGGVCDVILTLRTSGRGNKEKSPKEVTK